MKLGRIALPFPRIVFLCFFLCLGFVANAKTSKPNILFIIADQWRAQAFGYAGDPNVKTPHLDSLAKQSVNFQNAVAAVPVCGPTRASLLTGQRALTHGVFMNDVPLSPDAVTLAKVLKGDGYDTGYVGKWHLNGDGRSNFIPRERRQGFDYWKVLECTHNYNKSAYYGDGPEKLQWEGYDAFAQTEDAKTFLKSRKGNKKPFLFMLAWGPPHDPYFEAPERYRALYDPKAIQLRGNVPVEKAEQTRINLAGYYAHCTALDDSVGQLLQTLRDAGLEKNTIVVFTSDHGDMLGSQGFVKKQKPWDESIRVPLLVRWLGVIKPQRLEAPFNSEDFLPTLLSLTGGKVPKSSEGIDYSHYMQGGKNPGDNATLISCVTPFGEWESRKGGKEYRGIRTDRYTYVRDLAGPWLLFDNATDPLQQKNLVNQSGNKKLQQQLDNTLNRKLTEAHDEFLPGATYVNQWGYKTNENGTVPYKN